MGVKCCNCFKELLGQDVCPYCGYDGRDEEKKYPQALRAGTILNGEFELGRVLGQGGFGITYLALHKFSGRIVALKEYYPKFMAGRVNDSQVLPHGTSCVGRYDNGKRRFMEEAKTIAKLADNKVVVEIYSYFEQNNTAYFAMEYIQGCDLADFIAAKGGKLSVREAKSVLLPAIKALGEVHKTGVIHRDISPGNIMIEAEGRVRLLDFGSARACTGEETSTLDLAVNHGFSPVELYSSTATRTATVDIYSMGAVLYLAITGVVPQTATERIFDDKLRSPMELGVDISSEDNAAIMKALQIKAEDRFGSMEEFADALTPSDDYVDKAFMALGKADWADAATYLELAEKQEGQNPYLYIGKLMLKLRLRKREELSSASVNVKGMPDYDHAYALADDALKTVMEKWGCEEAFDIVGAAYQALDREAWEEADALFVSALKENPADPEVYIGRLLCELKLKKREQLRHASVNVKGMANFKLAYVYADKNLQKEMSRWGKKKISLPAMLIGIAVVLVAVVLLIRYLPNSEPNDGGGGPQPTIAVNSPRLLMKTPLIEFEAKNSDYNCKRLNIDVKPNTTYTIKIDEIKVTEGVTAGASIKLFTYTDVNSGAGTTLDAELINISKNTKESVYVITTPATGVNKDTDLLIYSGIAGKTANVAVSYTGLEVYEGAFEEKKQISLDSPEILSIFSKIDIKAKNNSNYNFIKLGQALEANQTYTLCFDKITLTEGKSEGVSVRIFDFGPDGSEGKEVDSALIELNQSGSGYRCVLKTGSTVTENTDILLYAGIHGTTKNIGALYEGVKIYKGLYTGN